MWRIIENEKIHLAEIFWYSEFLIYFYTAVQNRTEWINEERHFPEISEGLVKQGGWNC